MAMYLPTTDLCLTVISTMFCVIAAVGNVVVIAAIVKSRRLHTTSNMYVSALAVIDIYTALIFTIKNALKMSNLTINMVPCRILICACLLGILGNLTMMETIGVDRFIAIFWPFKYRKYCTKSRAIKVSVGTIVLSVVFGGTLFSISMPIQQFEICLSNAYISLTTTTFMTVITGSVALELTVMYVAMFYKAMDHQRNLSIGYFNRNNGGMTIFDIKALKTCSVILGSFFAMWCPPLAVLNLAVHSDQVSYNQAVPIILLLPAVNAALDPFVYAVMRRDIRKGIRKLFQRPKPVLNGVESD